MIKRVIALIIFSVILLQPSSLCADDDRHRSAEGLFGGALGGALIGGLAGGRRGAGIGAGVGAGVGLLTGAAVDNKRRRERSYDDEYYGERPAAYQKSRAQRPQRDPHFYDSNLRREVFYYYDSQGNEQYYYLRRGQTVPLRNYRR